MPFIKKHMKHKIGILNGPNLGQLGKREPSIYGSQTLAELEAVVKLEADKLGIEVECYQTNHEGALIDTIEEWTGKVIGVVMNPGGFTHTSVALRDAIAGSGLRVIEVHISNVYKREEFRHKSLTAGVCEGVIGGLGFKGYLLAMQYLLEVEKKK